MTRAEKFASIREMARQVKDPAVDMKKLRRGLDELIESLGPTAEKDWVSVIAYCSDPTPANRAVLMDAMGNWEAAL